MSLAPTFMLCPLVIAASGGADMLFPHSRQTARLAPHLMVFHLVIHSTNLLVD